MNFSNYRFTLDIQKNKTQASIPVHFGDTGNRFYIALTDGGNPYIISDGCRVDFYAKKPNSLSAPLINSCIIENNSLVRYDFNKNTADQEGIHKCELRLYSPDGRLITTPSFTMVVDQRVIYDDEICTDEEIAALNAYGIIASEQTRVNAEKARGEAEDARMAFEESRVEAESGRIIAETERTVTEKTRAEAEESRVEAENARVSAEESRVVAENARVSVEESRVEAETAREASEYSRVESENARVSAEESRVEAENARVLSEESRVAAEESRVEAEERRIKAVNNMIPQIENVAKDINRNRKRLDNLEARLSDEVFFKATMSSESNVVPEGVCPYAEINRICSGYSSFSSRSKTISIEKTTGIESLGKQAGGKNPPPAELLDTLAIPEAVQNLDGYGLKVYPGDDLGAPSEFYNHIEFTGNGVKFVKWVHMIVLDGTEDWQSERHAEHFYVTGFPTPRCDYIGGEKTGYYQYCGACSHFDFYEGNETIGNESIEVSDVGDLYVYSEKDTLEDFTAYLAEQYANGKPVTIIYAMAEPIVTDITDLIHSDNLIKVESGGTIESVNGSGYSEPVEITYQLKE